VFPLGETEGDCPVCHCTKIRYGSTSGSTFQQMHIISVRHGGSDQSWNLLPGCGCNQRMRQQHLIDWMGTQGNKRTLLKDLFLRKYKSLVAPCHRSSTNARQLIEWVRATYVPPRLDEYQDWLVLLESDLRVIHLAVGEREQERKKVTSPYFDRPSSRQYTEMRMRLKRHHFHASYFGT